MDFPSFWPQGLASPLASAWFSTCPYATHGTPRQSNLGHCAVPGTNDLFCHFRWTWRGTLWERTGSRQVGLQTGAGNWGQYNSSRKVLVILQQKRNTDLALHKRLISHSGRFKSCLSKWSWAGQAKEEASRDAFPSESEESLAASQLAGQLGPRRCRAAGGERPPPFLWYQGFLEFPY